ncbi:MAG TPA: DNA-formamidopyrimidine glycosylase family protein [Candidatus Krumholzibacteria bacterium]|nr:DNA-formamidopyrimidine glycosylase family protein [Candidatus Krumholzibacteria bacterium]
MPELPDVMLYIERLEPRVLGQTLQRARLASPFLLRTVEPPLRNAEGKRVLGLRRLGKRIVFGLEDEIFLVLHLMIAGRLRWRDLGEPVPRKRGLAAFDFASGTLLLTEASTKKRASLHVVRGEAGLAALDPGGLEVLEADAAAFAVALRRENRTLKRVLTDPRLLSGIGNAYSDEILHRARMSPLQRTQNLDDAGVARLHHATQETLREWLQKLRQETGDAFPEKVTAFRPGMAVHGRYREPCPVCGNPVQRIVYAENECNYCATCQTDGKLLADRALSRLLREDWPRTLDELEEMKSERLQSSAERLNDSPGK